jgi:hypothetical protein
MKKTEEQPIEETLTMLTELVERQKRALEISDYLLSLKNRLVELSEKEVEIYKRQNKSLERIAIGVSVLLAISSFIHIIR